ncbi:hypothetical protein K1T71_007922 [Dendrolimus kikuchii]|uniref:Uncharacterized protein n=1 Tax=Dendrolimus kikuchii TaxID=765133 RepID=A0ACC1CZH6_9NEOP|nr:hypothetical protein K1T71_007922 [Dendrolimus kikuchii]
MKLNCIIQAVLGCLPIADPSLNQEAMKIMRIVDRICKCLVAYVTRSELTTVQPKYYSSILNSLILAKCVSAQLWENSPYVSKHLLATAGKVNFMLLEESHPRDLERIINKGPPMGNSLHKLFTLLPKYQLTMTPIDEKIVSVQLLLLNQAHLSENLDELTAGDAHKCYTVIGDSENNLHHLSSFKDKDLINVYDGSITYQITRKHNFEHKIFAHCISASFVGIDVSCEYLFKSFDLSSYPVDADVCTDNEFNTTKKVCKRQTTITETFKERKRKNKNDISQSKEKKKRDTAFIEKFHNLKDSFNITSKQLKDELHKTTEMSHNILDSYMTPNLSTVSVGNNKQSFEISALDTASESLLLDNNVDILEDSSNSSQVTGDVESILDEIENEISKSSNLIKESKKDENTLITKTTDSNNLKHCYINPYANPHPGARIRKSTNNCNKKTKYNFIDLLERNIDLDSDNEDSPTIENSTGFSDAVKNKIENYLKNTYSYTKPVDRVLEELINKEEETELPNICFTEIPKEKKSECAFNENNANDTTVTTEINIPVNTKVQNETNDLSEDINTENSRDILLHNSLNKITETKLGIKTKENKIHRSINNITSTDNLLVPLKKTLSLSEIPDNLPFYENNNSSISVNKPIGQTLHPNSENAVISSSSKNTNIQNKDLLHPETIYNLHVSNKVTKDVAYDTLTKEIVIPSTESQTSFPYTSKMNLHSTSSNPVALDKNNQTVRKYSYSITNIDYSTKNLPDHYIRVKRKLQVDVVAEIVSKKEKRDGNTNEKATRKEYKTNANLQNNKNVINYMDKVKSTSNDLKQTTRTVKNELHEDINNKIRDKVVVEDEETSKNYKDNTIKEHNISEFRMKSEPINRSQSSIKIRDSGKPAFTKIAKPKRPFKINQLHNIHVSLPESLIENSNTSSHCIRKCTKIDEQLIKHSPEKLKSQNVPDNINLAPLELKVVEIEIGPQECEPRIDLEPTDDVHMDQSMFDPKVLLQTLSLRTDNEAIILPPPEFSDNVDSGTSQVIRTLYTDMDSPNHFYNAKVPNSLCMDLQNIDQNTKEIDTLTLSKNSAWKLAKNTTDTCLDEHLNTKCVRSFTITQNSRFSSNNNSMPISRRHKLAQFSHSQKEKIKKDPNFATTYSSDIIIHSYSLVISFPAKFSIMIQKKT